MTIQTIAPHDLQTAIASGIAVDLIDVRTPEEFAGAHVLVARNVPLGGLDARALLAQHNAASTQPIYTICAAGTRSATAAEALIAAGAPLVLSVAGGMQAWIATGLPVVGGKRVRRPSKSTLLAIGAVAALWVAIAAFWGQSDKPAVHSNLHAPLVDFSRDVVEASKTKPVLVDFFATWCEPCTMLAPELESVADERRDRVTLLRIDIERQEDVAVAQKIEPIPDVRLWKGGHEVAHFIGFKPRAEVAAWLDHELKAP